MSLDKFMSSLRDRGMARTNRFRVTFVPPASLRTAYDLDKIQTYCTQAPLPGITLTLSENEMSGAAKKVAVSEGNDDADFVFYVGADMMEKEFFDRWMGLIVNPQTHRAAYYDDYVGQVIIETLAADGTTPTYGVKLVEAHPMTITAIQLDQTEQDAVMKLQVTFTWKKAYPV